MNRELKNDFRLLAIAATAVLLAMVGANTAFIIGVIGVPSALVCAGRRVVGNQTRNFRMRVVAYGACLLLFLAGPSGCAINTYRVEKAAKPIIEAIEQHRLKYGRYPMKSEVERVLASNPCPALDRRFYYAPLVEGTDYDLTCVTFGFNKHSYQGSRRNWVDWD